MTRSRQWQKPASAEGAVRDEAQEVQTAADLETLRQLRPSRPARPDLPGLRRAFVLGPRTVNQRASAREQARLLRTGEAHGSQPLEPKQQATNRMG
jgi:hypothetical protein